MFGTVAFRGAPNQAECDQRRRGGVSGFVDGCAQAMSASGRIRRASAGRSSTSSLWMAMLSGLGDADPPENSGYRAGVATPPPCWPGLAARTYARYTQSPVGGSTYAGGMNERTEYLKSWRARQPAGWGGTRSASSIAWEWLRDAVFVRAYVRICNLLNSENEPAAEAIAKAVLAWPASQEFAVVVDSLKPSCARSRGGQVVGGAGIVVALLHWFSRGG